MPRRTPARELKILNAIAEALNSSEDVRTALQRTLDLVSELLELPTGWVWLLDPDTDQFHNAAARNLPPYLQQPIRMTGYDCWCIGAFRRGELTAKNIDLMECSRLRPAVEANAVDETRGLRYHASVPLAFQGAPLGIMNLTRPAWEKLTREELRLLSTIAYQLGIALERARLGAERVRRARAEERARIARDIHDTLAQSLTAIAIHIEGSLNVLDTDPSRARDRLERALATTRRGLDDARDSVTELRAAPLDGKPLVEALTSLAHTFTSETGVRVRVHASGSEQLPTHVEAELFRIAQEALTNVRRHAAAHETEVRLAVGDGMVRLTVRDDGRGFDARAARQGHHGLIGMAERARLLGGYLRVRSAPNRGTRIVATVPLPGAKLG